MSNYSIGLSGLQTSSSAMDVVSNNIANASTVGYRAGEFIFEDQFFKALNPLDAARAGMGSSKQNIRRLWNMGAIQQSANTLDMAITGSMGLFRLTSNADDPSQTYYTRNGQFAISKDVDPSYPKRSYIVNENGMFLTGYTSTDGKELSSTHNHRLTMPPVSIDPVTTENSVVSVTLDARRTAFIPEANVAFDPEVPSTYNNKVSQTVYHLGDSGNPHTMELYYRRVEDKNMSVIYDGTYLKYEPNTIADPKASTEPQGGLVQNNKSYVVLTQESSGPNFDYLSSGNRLTNASAAVSADDEILVNVTDDVEPYARVIVNGTDSGLLTIPARSSTGLVAAATPTAAAAGTAEIATLTLTNNFLPGDLLNISVQGRALQYTVTTAASQSVTALATELTTFLNQEEDNANLGFTATSAAGVVTLTATAQNDPMGVAATISRAPDTAITSTGSVALSGNITLNKDDEVEFFNPVTTSGIAAAVTNSDQVTLSVANQDVQVGQYLWKKSAAPAPFTYTQLNSKVVEKSSTTLTLSDKVTLAAGESLVFYEPVTYSVILQDGSKVAMMGDHKKAASSGSPQEFTAVTSQIEVYGSLDGTMFNGTDSRFSTDTAIDPTVAGTYDPLAVMQFWGGQNIDAIRYDSVTGEPAFRSVVQVKGIVTSSGKTNGPGDLEISEDHPLEFDLDLTGTRHFATSFSVDANYQDGATTAMLSTVNIDPEGKIVGTYSDGREYLAGQLVLVNFSAVNGLVPVGNNVFQSSYMSGNEVNENVVVGKPGERGLGGIRAGAVEGSNVDLANELVKLLIQQRMYSANSQSIRAFDDTLTTTIRMTGG